MAQWGTCWLCKCEDPGLYTQHPHKVFSIQACVCSPGAGDMGEISRCCGLTGQPLQPKSWVLILVMSPCLNMRERERAQIPPLTSIYYLFKHVHVTHVHTKQTTAIATKRLGIIRTKGTWISRISQTSFKKHSVDNCESHKLISFSFHSLKSPRGHCTRSLILIRKTDSLNMKWYHHKEWSVLKGLRVKNASCEKILACFL